VALKTLSRLSADAAARFRREARAAARFLHPNLATILTSETWCDVPVLVFECLEGGTLAHRLLAGPSSPQDVARWGVLLAGALAAAHEGGVLHRDVKPSNIGFTTDGTPKLLDFGLAAVFDDAEEPGSHAGGVPGGADAAHLSLDATVSRLTRSGAIVGTIPYLSPEAVLGRPATAGFDLWGLTLSLYEAVTGRNPFIGETALETLNHILSDRVPDPRDFRRDCPAALALVLTRNLARLAEERTRTAAVLRAEFLSVAGSPAL
jgi:serine/threonine protein kinase